MILAVTFPSWLQPEIIPGFPLLRWYSLGYLVAFCIAAALYRRQIRERNFPMSEEDFFTMYFVCVFSLMIGARVFSVFVYESSDTYLKAPWLIFWPFRNGQFVGLRGISYHGGVIGGLTAIFAYSFKKKYDCREIGDMYAASIPLGYTFGRLGNFANGELYGRITASPLGMYFPGGAVSPSQKNFDLIREGAAALGLDGIAGTGGSINFPRHPSQLYEALFEGVVLWAVIWFFRNRKPFKGFLITLYISGYGLIRFFLEYFRQPDPDLGYRISFVDQAPIPDLSHPLLCFSTGQILCVGMILLGLAWALVASRLPDSAPVRVYPTPREQRQAAKKERRKERRRARGRGGR